MSKFSELFANRILGGNNLYIKKFFKEPSLVKKIFDSSLCVYIIILACLLVAHFPVLISDYLRQDDWNATFWSRNSLYFQFQGHPEYYNAIWELFRPVGGLILIITDYISINIENAKFVRFFNILLLSICSYLTYQWQIRISSENKIFALSFSIISFCLIASQLHTATAGYNGMIITTLMGQIAFILYYKAKMETNNPRMATRYIILSGILLLAGSMNYAITMMFYFLFLFIFYISNIHRDNFTKKQIYKFMFKATFFIIIIMLAYLLMAKSVNMYLDIGEKVHGGYIRSIHFDFDVMNKIHHILNMLKYSLNIFQLFPNIVDNTNIELSTNFFFFRIYNTGIFYTFLITLSSFIFALVIKERVLNKKNKKNKKHSFFKNTNNKESSNLRYLEKEDNFKKIFINILTILIITLILLIFTYMPALPLRVNVINGDFFGTTMTNRYFAVTMPFILYIMMWSFNEILSFKMLSFLSKLRNFTFLFVLFFGIYQCNFYLNYFIVGPVTLEMNHIRKNIEEKVLKVIESGNKPTIIIIRNPNIKEYVPDNDYNVSTNYSHNWLISACIYSLRQYDIKTIRKHKVFGWDNNGILISSVWGMLASVDDVTKYNLSHENPKKNFASNTIIIDMNELHFKRKKMFFKN